MANDYNRPVKCRLTKESLKKGEAYCVKFGTTNQYYKSKELYESEVLDKQNFDKAMKALLGVKPNMKMPIQYNVQMKKWHVDDGHPYKAIAMAVKSQRKNISYALSNKNFNSFNMKLMYIMKIIEGGLISGLEEYKRTETQSRMIDTTDIELLNESLKTINSRPKRDISEFL